MTDPEYPPFGQSQPEPGAPPPPPFVPDLDLIGDLERGQGDGNTERR